VFTLRQNRCSRSAEYAALVFLVRFQADVQSRSDQQRGYLTAIKDRAEVYEMGCLVPYTDVTPIECQFGDRESKTRVALVGDSYAAHWFPAIRKIAEDHDWDLRVYVKSACPWVSYEPLAIPLKRTYHECTQWRERVFEKMRELQPALLVLPASTYYPYLTHNTTSLNQIQKDEWKEAVEMSLLQFAGQDATVISIRNTPSPGYNAITCLSRAEFHGKNLDKACGFPLSENMESDLFEIEAQLFENTENAHMLDLTHNICPTDPCSLVSNGGVKYFDSHHLSASTAIGFSAIIEAELVKNGVLK